VNHETPILVTGATGNIGTELVKQLSVNNEVRNVRVREAVRSINKAAKIKDSGVES
jgi:uncharacterized protein YbjT (DUF2867 family)